MTSHLFLSSTLDVRNKTVNFHCKPLSWNILKVTVQPKMKTKNCCKLVFWWEKFHPISHPVDQGLILGVNCPFKDPSEATERLEVLDVWNSNNKKKKKNSLKVVQRISLLTKSHSRCLTGRKRCLRSLIQTQTANLLKSPSGKNNLVKWREVNEPGECLGNTWPQVAGESRSLLVVQASPVKLSAVQLLEQEVRPPPKKK